jgi:ABC-2 type transport system permease protein
MNRIGHIVRKEFLQLKRDPRLLPVVFLAPVLQLLLLGFAANLDVRDIPTVVCDLDATAASREFTAEFINSGYFKLKSNVPDIRAVDACLDDGLASVAIVIQRGFADRLGAGRRARVQILVDGSESQSATIGANYAQMIGLRYSQRILAGMFEKLQSLGLRPVRINPEVRIFYNPELRSRNFMIPGILGLILLVITTMLTSMAVVREYEVGTMEQLIVTPVRPGELIIGKLLPFFIIGIIDVCLVLVVAVFLFGVPIRGSVPLLFLMTILFMMTTLGSGLLISTVSRTQQQAMMTSVLLLMPMLMLAGFVFPVENMPRFFQWITVIVPLKYYLVIIRGLFLKGVGLADLWPQGLALLLFGAGILTLSVLRFRKRIG